MHRLPTLVVLLLLLVPPARAQESAEHVRLNQIGFYPDAPKEAVVVDAASGPFHVVTADGADTVFTGALGRARNWTASGETVRRADFSDLRRPGTYRLHVPGTGPSHLFEVHPAVHEEVARAALKAYYFQRTGLFLHPRYAGQWARPAGHPDTDVRIHASAATPERPEGTRIAAPRGWYDAGDFNKYVVNSGISTYTLLALYEHYPERAAALDTNIPESGDAVPDVLDEALWNVRWLLAMQDPHDGGVYNKLTHASFQGLMMPHEARAPRYVVQKGTAATLDFAAVTAQAARLAADLPNALPGLADSLRTAALEAWRWARRHPDVPYDQEAMNRLYDPDIVTGPYGDVDFRDEWAWAAAELAVTTGADSFLTVASPLQASPSVPWWQQVAPLGWYTLLHHSEQAAALGVDTTALQMRFLLWAERLAARRAEAPYAAVMGAEAGDFVWGSNAVAANQGMALLQAFRLTADTSFARAALANLDYLLGRNATGYSFVTGHGDRTPRHPHHRQSEADRIVEPVPGLLVGGPNAAQQDGCTYPSDLPARSYTDRWCSYASNEITINWNAPLVYLAAGLEHVWGEAASSSAAGPAQGVLPEGLHLQPPYPNPTRETAELAFTLARRQDVRVDLFDTLGRHVRHVHAGLHAPGDHRVRLRTSGLPGGAYFVRLQAGPTVRTRPLVHLP